MNEWECTTCGYVEVGEGPPTRCPDCGAPKEKFEHYSYEDDDEWDDFELLEIELDEDWDVPQDPLQVFDGNPRLN